MAGEQDKDKDKQASQAGRTEPRKLDRREVLILPEDEDGAHQSSTSMPALEVSRSPVRRRSESEYSLRQASKATGSRRRITAPSLLGAMIRIDRAGSRSSSISAFE